MNKKIVVLTLCRVFPVAHKKAGELTHFEDNLKTGEKIHTVRGNDKNVWNDRYKEIKSGKKYLSVREWTGRPYHTSPIEIARYDTIGLQNIEMSYCFDDDYPKVWINNKEVFIQEVAANDGLSVEDFVEWFFGNSKENTFKGVIIHFTDFRY
ncbi:MAG: hypothetical protein LBQ68_03575 [Clostridiales bacterium]|nr:hypothetical protein [Clostridiales bacterium]